MSIPLTIALPLMEGDEPISAVLSTEELLNYGGVVAKTTEGYRLLTNTILVDQAVKAAAGTMPRLSEVGGEWVAQPTLHQFAARGFNFLEPDENIIAGLCNAESSKLLAGPELLGALTRPLVTLYRDPNYSFELARRYYKCSLFKEQYSEGTYVKWKGMCPKHLGAVLQ